MDSKSPSSGKDDINFFKTFQAQCDKKLAMLLESGATLEKEIQKQRSINENLRKNINLQQATVQVLKKSCTEELQGLKDLILANDQLKQEICNGNELIEHAELNLSLSGIELNDECRESSKSVATNHAQDLDRLSIHMESLKLQQEAGNLEGKICQADNTLKCIQQKISKISQDFIDLEGVKSLLRL